MWSVGGQRRTLVRRVRFIADNNLSDVVLLGHSFGGTVIARVAEEIPDLLRRLIF